MTIKDAVNGFIKSKYISFKSMDKITKQIVFNSPVPAAEYSALVGNDNTVTQQADYFHNTIVVDYSDTSKKFHLIVKKLDKDNNVIDTEDIKFDISGLNAILNLDLTYNTPCSINPADVCGLNFTSIVDFKDIKLDEDKLILKDDKGVETSIEAKATVLAANKIEVLKLELQTQWEEQRITGNELAQAIMGGVVQLSNGSIQEALALKNSLLDSQSKILDVKLKSKQMQSDIYLSLLKAVESQEKINEIKARTELYREQAKGFSDKTKLDSVRMVTNAWTTLYTQNQQIDVPDFAQAAQVQDTIKDWFLSIGLDDPSDA